MQVFVNPYFPALLSELLKVGLIRLPDADIALFVEYCKANGIYPNGGALELINGRLYKYLYL